MHFSIGACLQDHLSNHRAQELQVMMKSSDPVAMAGWVRCQGWDSENNWVLVNLGANKTRFALNILGMYLRSMPEGKGLINILLTLKVISNLSLAFIQLGLERQIVTVWEWLGGSSPRFLRLMNQDSHIPAALPSSICLWDQPSLSSVVWLVDGFGCE